MNTLMPQISKALETFCNEFSQNPYRHRNEHSIHMQIAESLSTISSLKENPITHLSFPIKSENRKLWKVQRLQKEWPTKSSIPTRENQNRTYRRGHFDLAILPFHEEKTPLELSTWRDYYEGRLPSPEIIFEVGLDYKAIDHLKADVIKYKNSKNNCPAIFIHLYRDDLNKMNSEFKKVCSVFEDYKIDLLFQPILTQDTHNQSASSAFVGVKFPPSA